MIIRYLIFIFLIGGTILSSSGYSAECYLEFMKNRRNVQYRGVGSTVEIARANAVALCEVGEGSGGSWRCDKYIRYASCSKMDFGHCTPSDYLVQRRCGSCEANNQTSYRRCWYSDNCGNFKGEAPSQVPCN